MVVVAASLVERCRQGGLVEITVKVVASVV